MINGLIGKKLGMITTYADDGEAIPVTVVEAGPCPVVQIKTREKEGYDAVQVGFAPITRKKVRRSAAGKVKNLQDPEGKPLRPQKIYKEFEPLAEGKFPSLGQVLDVSIFEGVAKVGVRGRSKGKGFQGVMKRHGHHGGKRTHGSMFHRAPGSLGCNAYPAEVKPGRKLPGHMGHRNVSTRNLRVERVDVKRNLLFLRGAVPGPAGGTVFVYRMD